MQTLLQKIEVTNTLVLNIYSYEYNSIMLEIVHVRPEFIGNDNVRVSKDTFKLLKNVIKDIDLDLIEKLYAKRS